MRTLLAALLCVSAGCGDDQVCGPGEATADAITVDVAGESLSYGNFTSSANNDCPDEDGVPTALTIEGEQTSPTPSRRFVMTFCLPSPDEIGSDPVPLAGDARLEVVDSSGEAGGCIISRDSSMPATGTISFVGYCDDGVNGQGYAIQIDGAIPGIRTCPVDAGPGEDAVTLTISGQAAVSAINP